jgi:hypothetical protein
MHNVKTMGTTIASSVTIAISGRVISLLLLYRRIFGQQAIYGSPDNSVRAECVFFPIDLQRIALRGGEAKFKPFVEAGAVFAR